MNPVLKRFLKGLGAAVLGAALTAALSFAVTFLQTDPTLFGGTAMILASLILAVEKALPNNL